MDGPYSWYATFDRVIVAMGVSNFQIVKVCPKDIFSSGQITECIELIFWYATSQKPWEHGKN